MSSTNSTGKAVYEKAASVVCPGIDRREIHPGTTKPEGLRAEPNKPRREW